jgi:hypothetical protein
MFEMTISKRRLTVFAVSMLLFVCIFCYLYMDITIRQQALDDNAIPIEAVRHVGNPFKAVSGRAVGDIVDVTVKNAGLIRWEKFKKELRMEYIHQNTGSAAMFFVALSLYPQEGMVACYRNDGDIYRYKGKVANLLPVTALSVIPGSVAGDLLVVDQHQNEMAGAFFEADYKDIFQWINGYPNRVLGLITGYSAYWNQIWDGVKENASWLLLKQTSDVEYRPEDGLIEVTYRQYLMQSDDRDLLEMPRPDNYSVRRYRVVREKYIWDQDFNRFILGRVIDRQTGQQVALLEDYRDDISSLVGRRCFNMVKIMDSDGKIEIIPSSRIEE